jgi:hypothetical protein
MPENMGLCLHVLAAQHDALTTPQLHAKLRKAKVEHPEKTLSHAVVLHYVVEVGGEHSSTFLKHWGELASKPPPKVKISPRGLAYVERDRKYLHSMCTR